MKGGSTFLNEGGQAGQLVGVSDAVMKILVDIDPKLGGGPHQRLKGIPRPDAFSSACLQAHISLADTLSGSQLRRIIVQENLWMVKHHEQRIFLGTRAGEPLI